MSRLREIHQASRKAFDYVWSLLFSLSGRTPEAHLTPTPDISPEPNPDGASESTSGAGGRAQPNITGDRPEHYYGDKEKGHWIHLEDVLQQIELYASMVSTLKRVNADMYTWYRRFGAHITPSETLYQIGGLDDTFLHTQPASGMIFMPSCYNPEEDDYNEPVFVAFDKKDLRTVVKKEKVLIQPTNNAIYRVTLIIKSTIRRDPIGFSFFVSVSDSGDVCPLKERSGAYGCPSFEFSNTPGWDYPHDMRLFYNLHAGERKRKGKATEPIDEWATGIFAIVANGFSRASQTTQVRVHTKKGVVNLGVPLGRCPTFFKNRDIHVASDGRKKRIYHFVRAHTRNMPDGRVQQVKSHYRGVRRFSWSGYEVTITTPDRQMAPDTWTLPSVESDKLPSDGDYLLADQVGDYVSHLMECDPSERSMSAPRLRDQHKSTATPTQET